MVFSFFEGAYTNWFYSPCAHRRHSPLICATVGEMYYERGNNPTNEHAHFLLTGQSCVLPPIYLLLMRIVMSAQGGFVLIPLTDQPATTLQSLRSGHGLCRLNTGVNGAVASALSRLLSV